MDKYNKFISTNKVYMVVVAALIGTLLIFQHWATSAVFGVVFLLLVIYSIRSNKVREDEWKKFIEEFTENLDKATKSTLVNFPFPMMILGKQGNIKWYNQYFNELINNENILGKSAEDFIYGVSLLDIQSGDKKHFKKIKIGERHFELYTSVIAYEDPSKKDDSFILLYLYEVTETINLIKYIEENKEGLMLLEIDNMEDVLKSVVDDKKPLLIAEIERTINNYALSLKAMVKKFSSNKYVLSLQEKFINEQMESKFPILDEMRELNVGNKIAPTLSIGVGVGGDSPETNYKFALTGQDLAIGRGGDQVVVKNNENLTFFGGKTKEAEKRYRVRSRVISHALVELISVSSNVYIMGHVSPDIDCIGAALGINRACRLLGKDSHIIIDGLNNQIKEFMEEHKGEDDDLNSFISPALALNNRDDMTLLIVVDAHNKGNILNYELLTNFERFVIIDHHRKSKDFIEGALLNYIEPYASSTSEMVTEMLQYMVEKPTLTKMEAHSLLAGIVLDTKNFSFKTGVRTFEAASFLRKLGAETLNVRKFFSNSLDTFVKKAEIIKSATVENNMAIAICPPYIVDTVIAAQAADDLLNITGILASFVIVKIDSDILISGRSYGDVNVQVILEELGGGGHMTMAGVRLKDMSVEECYDKLKTTIDKYVVEGEN